VGNRVQFTYDLIGEESEAEVEVTLTIQGKTYRASELHLEGAYGKVQTGNGKVLWWNVMQDFPRGVDTGLKWRIEAGGKTFTSPTLGAKFVLIPAGRFTMGSPSSESGRRDNETQRQVTISQPFYLQKTHVTQGQWKRVMGNNPSYFENCGEDCPVEQVSWNDVQEFIRKLNANEGTDKYRLPTEAQWEYAARAGTTGARYGELHYIAWYGGNSGGKTHRVAQWLPNAWGLYDMLGNVWSWCRDWYGTYPSGSVTDPDGPSSGSDRVVRGGSWDVDAGYARAAFRYNYTRDNGGRRLGFRLLRTQ
jgi:formylglycine-generating enzyme required for sulfatase activity